MSFFDQVYKSIFKKEPAGQPKTILHEVLMRSSSFQSAYRNWKAEEKFLELCNSIYASYQLKQKGVEQDPNVHVLDSSYSNGLAISHSAAFGKYDFQYLMDWFSEEIKSLGYRVSNLDVLITDKGKYTETIEKSYLKPKNGTTTPLDQQYGNILIQYVAIDDKPSYLKLQANVYNDRLYKPALPFEELTQFLFVR
ncbi:MAG: hypothetical protein KI790_19390 [Cyclobacteriaceae bacterium]|nr:hypothetical protein [Cyclobacteriaceae bacterium HetDA_MAG_MS6]